MKKPLFTGVCTALVTPFLDDQVNYPMLQQLLKRQVDAGIEAVVLCGTTGESPTLSNQEKLNIFRYAREYIGGQLKLIAGAGSNDTAHTVALSKAAESLGMDGILVVSPYYNKPTASGLIAHYKAVAKSVSIPVILYNVPGRTGVDIPVSVYRELCRIPNIAGVKEASADITKITKIIASCGSNLPVWTGNDELITPAMTLGAMGVISVISNLLPRETQALTTAALTGNFSVATEIQIKLQPIIEALFLESNPIPIKEAMNMIGYDCGPCRLPLTDASTECKEKLEHLIKN